MPDQHILTRSEDVQEILTAVPHWMISWGNSLLLILLFALLTMSWMIQYPDVINAEVTITSSNPPQKIFAARSGNIEKILIQDEQLVFANQAIAIIESTANHQDVFLLQSVIDSVVFQKDSFYFPVEQLPILNLGDLEVDYTLFENSYEQYLLHQQLQPFSNSAQNHKNALNALQSRLVNYQKQKQLNEEEIVLKNQDLDRSKSLFEQGLISAQNYEIKQLDWLQASRNLKQNDINILQVEETIGEVHLSIKKNHIDRIQEEKKLLQNLIQSFSQLKKAIKTWEMNYVIKSGIDGYISFLSFQSNKQRINTGDLMFSIIPNQQKDYFAKLQTTASNSGKIKIGQPVIIKLLDYTDSEFGQIQGTIMRISPITDDQGNYLLQASLTNGLTTTYNHEIEFKQEMQGSAEIITEDLRLLERFLYQIKDIFY